MSRDDEKKVDKKLQLDDITIRAYDKKKKKWLEGDYVAEYARKETNLIWCDLNGIVIGDGCAYLLDECGSWECLDTKRFDIVITTKENK